MLVSQSSPLGSRGLDQVSKSTQTHYRSLVRRIMRAAGRNYEEDVERLSERDYCAGALWLMNRHDCADATLRLYKSALSWGERCANQSQAKSWDGSARTMIDSIDCHGKGRTTRRRRYIPEKFEQWLKGIELLGLQEGVRLFFLANVHVGLRPVEWLGAKFLCPWPHKNETVVLHVRSAKTTHGRGLGEWREVCLDGLDADSLCSVLEWWKWQRAWFEKQERWRSVDFETCEVHVRAQASEVFYRNLKDSWQVVRAAAIEEGVLTSGEMKGLIFYSSRHQAVASAKLAMGVDEVARIFGHADIRTTESWYGKRKHGRGGYGVHPYADARFNPRDTERKADVSQEILLTHGEPVEQPVSAPVLRQLADDWANDGVASRSKQTSRKRGVVSFQEK